MSSVKELYKEYNSLQVDYLHDYKILNFMHRFFFDKQTLPEIFHDYFSLNSSIHNHNTRISSNPHLHLYSSNFGKRCLEYRGSALWNSIPNSIRNINAKHLFKTALMNYVHSLP
jgi:hypothetical protein